MIVDTSGNLLARNTKLRNTYQIRSALSRSELAIVYTARLLDNREKVIVKEFFRMHWLCGGWIEKRSLAVLLCNPNTWSLCIIFCVKGKC